MSSVSFPGAQAVYLGDLKVWPAAGMAWAKVTGGTVTTVNNPDGSVDEVHTFTADGTLTVDSPGYARVLIVGGGGGGAAGQYGNGGRATDGIRSLPSGALPVVVGAGGLNAGGPSSIGTLAVGRADLGIAAANVNGAGSTLTDQHAGLVSDITGTPVAYAKSGGDGPASIGGGGWNGPGTAGVVIVRVQKSAPTVSGVAASGGTETTYTGDGVNGVLGQKYKVHTFTADGSLVVTQGGVADVLLVSRGGYAKPSTPGCGGQVYAGTLTLAPGSYDARGPWDLGGEVAPGARLGTLITAPTPVAESAANATGLVVTSSITGTTRNYGGVGTPANAGGGAVQGAAAYGTAGVVIVRYEIA